MKFLIIGMASTSAVRLSDWVSKGAPKRRLKRMSVIARCQGKWSSYIGSDSLSV